MSNVENHTSGPWYLVKYRDINETIITRAMHETEYEKIDDPSYFWGIEILCKDLPSEYAAALDMLGALERCYEIFNMDEVDTAISMQCGMAISKAKGELK